MIASDWCDLSSRRCGQTKYQNYSSIRENDCADRILRIFINDGSSDAVRCSLTERSIHMSRCRERDKLKWSYQKYHIVVHFLCQRLNQSMNHPQRLFSLEASLMVIWITRNTRTNEVFLHHIELSERMYEGIDLCSNEKRWSMFRDDRFSNDMFFRLTNLIE